MKKANLIIVSVILFSVLIFGFKPLSNSNGNWSEWSESACYKGIDYRMREVTSEYSSIKGKNAYDLEIRNRYKKTVNVSFGIRENYNSSKGGQIRQEIKPGNDSEPVVPFYVVEGSQIVVLIGRLRFDDESGSYYKCDK